MSLHIENYHWKVSMQWFMIIIYCALLLYLTVNCPISLQLYCGIFIPCGCPSKTSCQDLEKNLGKIFSRSCKNLARNHPIQDFHMDLKQESWQVSKILASAKSWHGFGTDFLPTCQILRHLIGKILQDIFDRAIWRVCHIVCQNRNTFYSDTCMYYATWHILFYCALGIRH